jgi:hypothetical protein
VSFFEDHGDDHRAWIERVDEYALAHEDELDKARWYTDDLQARRAHAPPWSNKFAVVALFYPVTKEGREWLWPDEGPDFNSPRKGQRSTRTGRSRGRPRRPMPMWKRAVRWPIHEAAVFVGTAEIVLRELYPNIARDVVQDRAREVAVYVSRGAVNVDQLNTYFVRPKGNRRRLDTKV